MQRHTYYQTRQYQKLSVGFDRKKRNRDVRNAFCDIKTGLNMQEMDAASPIRLYTGPNENRVSPNIADLVSTRKLACSTSILNCRTYCGGSQVHNIGTSVGAKIVTQKSDYSVQLPLHSQTNSHATTYILSNTSVSKVICWF